MPVLRGWRLRIASEPAARSRQRPARSEPVEGPASSRPGGGFVEEGPVELTDLPRAGVDADDRGLANGDAEIIWDDEPAPPKSRRGSPASPASGPGVVSDADFDRIADEETRRASAREAGPDAPRRGRPKPSDPDPSRPTESPPGRRNGPAAEARGKPSRNSARARVDLDAVSGPRARPRRRISLGMIFVLLSAARRHDGRLADLVAAPAGVPADRREGEVGGHPVALEQGDFDKAHNLLSAARKAVDALGGGVEDADEIRRAADEAEILVNLCIKKLEDLLAEATSTEEWAEKFDTLYKGQSYIFETRVVATPAEGESGSTRDRLLGPPAGRGDTLRRWRHGPGGSVRSSRPDRLRVVRAGPHR